MADAVEPLGKLARCTARGVLLSGARVVDHLPGTEMRRSLAGEAQEQCGREREVAGRDHPDSPRPRGSVDLLVVRRCEAARADDDADPAFDRDEHIALDDRGVRVVDEHVGRDSVERLGDGVEACGVGARDSGDELEVVRRLDRRGDRAARPAGDARDADANHDGPATSSNLPVRTS